MKVNNEVLSVVITGMEYSGTTLLGSLLSTSMYSEKGAFECGLLLAVCPSDFVNYSPFYEWFCTTEKIGHWGLSNEARERVLSNDDFKSAYRSLTEEYSKVINYKINKIVDKTPAYSYDLLSVTSKISNDVPVLITIKDTLTLYYSYKKRKYNLFSFIYRHLKFSSNINDIKKRKNLKLIKHSTLENDPKLVLDNLKSILPEIEFEHKSHLNFNLNPLKKDYDFALEYRRAEKSLNFIEKHVIKFLEYKLQKSHEGCDVI